jgi:hypothetical protein
VWKPWPENGKNSYGIKRSMWRRRRRKRKKKRRSNPCL